MFSRSEPGLPISAALHLGLLAAMLFTFSHAPKFEDALETVAVDVVSDSQINEVSKGEKSAKIAPPAVRAEKAHKVETRPEPPTHEAKRDVSAPPPQAKPAPEPNPDEAPQRAAQAAPPPPSRPKPVQAAAESEPDDAEVVKPKPPTRPNVETAKTPAPPEKPKERPRLNIDDISKLLDQKPKGAAGAPKPKSGDERAPKSKFNAAAIDNLLSHEAPQQRGSTANERVQLASLGATNATGAHLTPSMEARINQYINDHYQPCWAEGLSMGRQTYKPQVLFHLTRDGALEGAPKLETHGGTAVEQARDAQALQAVRRCSPMKIPPEFLPYYEQAWHEIFIEFKDRDQD